MAPGYCREELKEGKQPSVGLRSRAGKLCKGTDSKYFQCCG